MKEDENAQTRRYAATIASIPEARNIRERRVMVDQIGQIRERVQLNPRIRMSEKEFKSDIGNEDTSHRHGPNRSPTSDRSEHPNRNSELGYKYGHHSQAHRPSRRQDSRTNSEDTGRIGSEDTANMRQQQSKK